MPEIRSSIEIRALIEQTEKEIKDLTKKLKALQKECKEAEKAELIQKARSDTGYSTNAVLALYSESEKLIAYGTAEINSDGKLKNFTAEESIETYKSADAKKAALQYRKEYSANTLLAQPIGALRAILNDFDKVFDFGTKRELKKKVIKAIGVNIFIKPWASNSVTVAVKDVLFRGGAEYFNDVPFITYKTYQTDTYEFNTLEDMFPSLKVLVSNLRERYGYLPVFINYCDRRDKFFEYLYQQNKATYKTHDIPESFYFEMGFVRLDSRKALAEYLEEKGRVL